jgi:hypothetical protein
MTTLQHVLFELDGPYLGHPYFVTGHALYNAVAQRVDEETRRSLHASHGVFLPGEYGEYPPDASQDGYAGKLGQSLPEMESYADVFTFRDAAQRWLLDSRPRDAHNVHPLQQFGPRVAFAETCWFGKPAGMRNRRRSVDWYVHAYFHADEAGVVPLSEDVLDGLRVGGARNYGFGELSVADTQTVSLDELDYSTVTEAEECTIELCTPYVLATEYPGADGQDVPWWWGVADPEAEVRRRETRLAQDAETYDVTVADHGQVFAYTGHDAVATARNGLLRVGTHSRFGYGELRVRPASQDRVAARAQAQGGEV